MMIAAGAAVTGTFKAEIKLKSTVIRIQESILKTQVIQKNVKDIFQKKNITLNQTQNTKMLLCRLLL